MSDEEKKAIEMIEHIQECNTLIGYGVEDRTILAKALLNLIEKQSKEIEELKKYEKYYKKLERKINKVLTELDWIDDDMMKCCSMVDVNGIDIVKILKEE